MTIPGARKKVHLGAGLVGIRELRIRGEKRGPPQLNSWLNLSIFKGWNVNLIFTDDVGENIRTFSCSFVKIQKEIER